MSIHDLIFFIGSVGLCLALIPALKHKIAAPRWTAAITATVLAIFAINYATMGFPLSTIALAGQALLWFLVMLRPPTKLAEPNQWHASWYSPTKRFPGWEDRDEIDEDD